MPQVGKKKFPYTPGGEAKAKAFGQKTGTPVKYKYDMATQTHKRVAPQQYPDRQPGSAPAAKPNPSAPVGQGGRFAALKQKLSGNPAVEDPGALAAAIGRKKYGAAKFNSLSK